MSGWLEGKVVEYRAWTEALFSLRVAAPALRFEAGQFVRIGLDVDGERIARPFSFVNAPDDPLLEFYGVIVPDGPLSPRLAQLRPGDALHVADNPSGFLVLSEIPAAEDLWLLSTGTGIAPFLSILRTDAPWARFRRVVLVHAVRRKNELAYAELIDEIRQAHPERLSYVRFVSREPATDVLEGRIPAALRDGRLAAAGGSFTPERSQFLLCGNPDMLKDTAAALIEQGFRKNRRRTPGHITVESFW
jgi:ferredoxin/flavodoxin---NADP+ reductase